MTSLEENRAHKAEKIADVLTPLLGGAQGPDLAARLDHHGRSEAARIAGFADVSDATWSAVVGILRARTDSGKPDPFRGLPGSVNA